MHQKCSYININLEKWWNRLYYKDYKSLATAKRLCDCSVLYLRPKSSLCTCPHYIVDLMGHFRRIFRVEGDNSFRTVLEMLTDNYFILSQYTHLTYRQMDGQTYDSNTVHCTTCSRTVKILWSFHASTAYISLLLSLSLMLPYIRGSFDK